MTWDAPTLVYAAARWLYYSALFLVVGAAVARWAVVPMVPAGAPAVGRIVRIARLASVTLALAVVGRLYLQSRAMVDPDEPVTLELVKAVLAGTWGKGWMAQGSAALVVLVGWRSMRLGDSGAARGLVAIGSLGLVLASPLTGHAVGLPAAGRLGYPLMVAHVAAGAAWLGTLGVLVLSVIGRPGGPELSQVVGRFSSLALPAGAVAIGAGALVAWRYLGGLEPLTTTPYGRTLLIKLGLLAGVAGTGAYNWRVVLPRLKRGEDAPVRSSATFEIVVGLALLAVTSVLVSLAAPGEHSE